MPTFLTLQKPGDNKSMWFSLAKFVVICCTTQKTNMKTQNLGHIGKRLINFTKLKIFVLQAKQNDKWIYKYHKCYRLFMNPKDS